MSDISNTADTVRVDIRSAWLSKINWTQVVGIASSILALITAGKLNISADTQVMIVLVIQALVGITTWVMKTWYTSTITTASAEQAKP